MPADASFSTLQTTVLENLRKVRAEVRNMLL
jgi:hypothetical protein